MRNRAKCKLCESIIESVTENDNISCKCGAIAVDGGSNYRCSANDWNNFIRIDDDNNEIVPMIKQVDKPNREELLKMLDEMIKNIEGLPTHAMSAPVTHYDLVSTLILLGEILRAA